MHGCRAAGRLRWRKTRAIFALCRCSVGFATQGRAPAERGVQAASVVHKKNALHADTDAVKYQTLRHGRTGRHHPPAPPDAGRSEPLSRTR
jgi:hypothetical protein